ncbi:MAG TPA: hypothetical protein DHW02_14435 [Ktedonobacter sp.]|nr:hypothetical protein [Ktedonobacter sp.]
MTQERQETRAEEIARVRSYLASQSMKRTPAQLVEALQEAHQQFVSALATIPEAQSRTIPREGEWSALDVLLHMHKMAAFDSSSISAVLERGEQPPEIQDVIVSAPPEAMRATLLAELEQDREQLFALVQHTDGQKALDITWLHPEFGMMNWREWTLFARVHTLDHARQLQSIATSIASSKEGTEREASN